MTPQEQEVEEALASVAADGPHKPLTVGMYRVLAAALVRCREERDNLSEELSLVTEQRDSLAGKLEASNRERDRWYEKAYSLNVKLDAAEKALAAMKGLYEGARLAWSKDSAALSSQVAALRGALEQIADRVNNEGDDSQACVSDIGHLARSAATISPAPQHREVKDQGCICSGNWRLIVKEHESLFDKKYTRDGKEYVFCGIVNASPLLLLPARRGEEGVNRVFLSSPTNSQMFTACCSVAICHDEGRCPRCKAEVYPGDGYADHERNRMRWRMAYRPPTPPPHPQERK